MMTIIQNKIENTTFDINLYLQKSTRFLWISIGILFACYLYFIGAITFSIINQQSYNHQIKNLTSNMSQQEVVYLNLQKNLTKDLAISSGLVGPTNVSFATQQKAFAWNVGQ